jgi:hypothetical protein
MIYVNGLSYVTAAEAPASLGPDITAALVRDWKRRRLITGYRVGRETWYRLDELVEVEYVLRNSRTGRPRRAARTGQMAL